MPSLQLSGLSTGIDTAAIVKQLIELEKRRLVAYQNRKTQWEKRQDSLGDLESKLRSFRTSVKALSNSDLLREFSISSSDSDIVTAEATNKAFEGNHTVVINQMATSERLVHNIGMEYAEDLVGKGKFIYSYNHKEAIIDTTAETTLEDLVGLINNDADNPGVTASLLYYNNAFHMVLNSQNAGSEYSISINSSSTEKWEMNTPFTQGTDKATLATKLTQLDQFTANSGLVNGDHITITGIDHNGNAVSSTLNVTSNTRLEHLIAEINDAFDGTAKAVLENGKIVLADTASGTSNLSLSLTYTAGSGGTTDLTLPTLEEDWSVTQGGATDASLANFTGSAFTKSQSAQDSKIRVDGFPSNVTTSEVQTLTLDDVATGGTFTLTYKGQTTAPIAYNADTATIQAALEALSTVSAGDITAGGTGLDQAGDTTFTFNAALGDVGAISINKSGLTGPTSAAITETTKGSDGYISRSANTIDDVIYGVTLHLHNTTDATGEKITLTRNIQAVKDKINTMVNNYNKVVTLIQEKTGYNQTLKMAGDLMGDYAVSIMEQQFRNPVVVKTKGFLEDIDTYITPGQIGFTLDRDGMLTFDSNKFDEAIAKDYIGTLSLIGADKTGSSTSQNVKFYSANSNYTKAGTYDVEVTVSGGVITPGSARIKLEGETVWRVAIFSGNTITGISDFDSNGAPVYPENSLQLTVNLTQDGTHTAKIRVKQGFTGAVEDALDKMLKATTGTLTIDQDHTKDQIKWIMDKIDRENTRLTKKEGVLRAKFARPERNLSLMQSQMAALNMKW
ncbi:MAG: hypothetical protein E4H40_03055 [Candidatus Brocadiia bacterium]|nr:MAG: hypothetical protein E4H40_03055 [Candidatus Brocadiia bacterium]